MTVKAVLQIACFVGLLTALPAHASEMSSASFRLIGSTLNSGGAPDMQSEEPFPQFGSLAASIGQSEVLGFNGSDSSLQSQAPGVWPVVLSDLPSLDTDHDAIQAFRDNCPFAFNPQQTDTAGIGFASLPDGTGDACQCGDVNNDGTVDEFDITTFQLFLASPLGFPLSPLGVSKCTVLGELSFCDILDLSVIRRTIEGPDLAPGIFPVCEAALAP